MATTMRKRAATTTDELTSAVSETIAPVETKPEKKVFKDTDGIRCRSITVGGLYMEGIKSKILYQWANDGDETEVEFQDLLAAIRSNSTYITAPYFVIMDEDFVSQYPQIEKIYASMYSVEDLRGIFSLRPADMKATIEKLPKGAKDSVKHLASQMVSSGALDSVQKIKVLDDLFGTELMLVTGLFNK